MRWSRPRLLVFVGIVAVATSIAVQVGAHAPSLALLSRRGIANEAAETPEVKLTSDKTSVLYPSIITLRATVTTVTPETSTTAVFEIETADSAVWMPLATVVSKPGAPGRFAAFAAPNAKNANYRVTVGDLSSNLLHIAVYVPMGKPKAVKSTVKVGQTLEFTGTIRPFHPNTAEIRLTVQKYNPRTRHWAQSVNTTVAPTVAIDSDTSEWVHDVTPVKADIGRWRIRSFHECIRHTGSYSAWKEYFVVK